jgi:hypothetical protein
MFTSAIRVCRGVFFILSFFLLPVVQIIAAEILESKAEDLTVKISAVKIRRVLEFNKVEMPSKGPTSEYLVVDVVLESVGEGRVIKIFSLKTSKATDSLGTDLVAKGGGAQRATRFFPASGIKQPYTLSLLLPAKKAEKISELILEADVQVAERWEIATLENLRSLKGLVEKGSLKLQDFTFAGSLVSFRSDKLFSVKFFDVTGNVISRLEANVQPTSDGWLYQFRVQPTEKAFSRMQLHRIEETKKKVLMFEFKNIPLP